MVRRESHMLEAEVSIMADQHYEHGSMNMAEKTQTWEGFVRLIKWSTIATAVILLIGVLLLG